MPLIGYFAGGFIIGWAKPVPFNPYNLRNQRWGEALVAIAGPLSNISLAIIFGLFIRLASDYGFINPAFLSLAGFVVMINIVLAIFNLVPIPPLDGSKILSAFLPYKWHGFMQNLEKFGLILVFVFIFLFWPVMSPIINFLFTFLIGQPML